MEKIMTLTLSDVTAAFNAVRSGAIVGIALKDMERILIDAHRTEFFNEKDALMVERVQVQMKGN